MRTYIFNVAPRLFCTLLPVILCNTPTFANKINSMQINPHQHTGWDIGIEALYLKTSFSDGFAYLDDTRIAPNTDKRNPLDLNWGWGFKVEGSYHFCPNSDLILNWYHYKKSSRGTFVFRTNPIADSYTITPDWDAVNLEFGQSIYFDQIKKLRLHGGLQYANIRTTYHGNGVDPIAGPGTEYDVMKYDGIGPRVGADLSVGLFKNGLSGYVAGDLAMLVGRSTFNFNETFGTGYTTSGNRTTVVVPELGLKIGAKYAYAIPCGNLIFDVGYLVINYFNPLHLQDDFASSETNFALNGWYAGINLTL